MKSFLINVLAFSIIAGLLITGISCTKTIYITVTPQPESSSTPTTTSASTPPTTLPQSTTPIPKLPIDTSTPKPTPTPRPDTSTPKPATPRATIIDVTGMTHEVEEVYNSSLYDWAKQMLTININYVRSAAKIIETLKIPITSVRRIIYQDAPIPQNLQKLFQAERPVSIEMNDGSLTLLTKTLVVNIDAQGNIARSIESTDSSFYPRGVSGSITTQAGTKEKFYIDGEKIKSLEFHHPLIPIPTPLLTSATPTPVKLRATIIDKTGTEYKVENPTAYYRAGGRWIIGPPSSTEAGLNIEISKITGAATVTEVINIPFTQLKRATFTDTQIQQSLQTLFKAEKPISIERNDGSLTLISKTLLVDSDAQRKITRSVGLTSYSFVVKDHGYNCYLDTFNGGATTQYGTEQVTISFDDAKSIEIEQP